jgi:hypothetical protein
MVSQLGGKQMLRAVSHLKVTAILLIAVLPMAMESCSKSKTATGAAAPRTFASPEDAGAAVLTAALSGDQAQLIGIFGPKSASVLFTGDPNIDRARLNDFAAAYHQMHRWGDIKAGGKVLVVGLDNMVFPIPIGKNSSGQWVFDTEAGKDEILARRIGKNELTAMDATIALADAQQLYHLQIHDNEKVKQYAQKFVSDPGTHDGLYWPAANGQTASPLAPFRDFVTVQSSSNAGADAEFNGYRYRILDKGATAKGTRDYVVDGKMTGGFAILAYPVEYRNSGITSFLIGSDDTLYQKDLGENTATVAASLAEYNPADGWTPAAQHVTSASRSKQ